MNRSGALLTRGPTGVFSRGLHHRQAVFEFCANIRISEGNAKFICAIIYLYLNEPSSPDRDEACGVPRTEVSGPPRGEGFGPRAPAEPNLLNLVGEPSARPAQRAGFAENKQAKDPLRRLGGARRRREPPKRARLKPCTGAGCLSSFGYVVFSGLRRRRLRPAGSCGARFIGPCRPRVEAKPRPARIYNGFPQKKSSRTLDKGALRYYLCTRFTPARAVL